MTDLVAHARSAGVRNPRLDMFNVPPTDLSMSSRRFVKISPFNAGINPVTFQVDPQEDFIDLNESFFEVEWTWKVTGLIPALNELILTTRRKDMLRSVGGT